MKDLGSIGICFVLGFGFILVLGSISVLVEVFRL